MIGPQTAPAAEISRNPGSSNSGSPNRGSSNEVRAHHVAPKSFLVAVARQQLTAARNTRCGRSAQAVCGGATDPLRHLVIALRAGEALGSEVTAGSLAWTVQILQGHIVLSVGRARRFGWPGELLAGPGAEYQLLAQHDTVLLVTLVSPVSPVSNEAA